MLKIRLNQSINYLSMQQKHLEIKEIENPKLFTIEEFIIIKAFILQK